MYKNLNAAALGVSGRQSELIELALTYGFRGLDLDILDMVKRADSHGLEPARRFIASANLKTGGFDLPVDLQTDDSAYDAELQRLDHVAEVAESIGAHGCYATIQPATDESPYHENFERHRVRLAQIADILEPRGIRVGVGLLAATKHREGKQHQFIHEAEALLTLIKTVGSSSVGLLLDVWNWHLGGGGTDQLSELKGEQIVAVRLADLPADADLATVDEQQRLLPGESGVIDSVATISLLANNGFEGPVTVYPHPSRFSGMTRDAIVQRASSVLDELWQSAGLNKAGNPAAAVTES